MVNFSNLNPIFPDVTSVTSGFMKNKKIEGGVNCDTNL